MSATTFAADDKVHAERRSQAREFCLPFSSEYPFKHHFRQANGGVQHYVDEGPREAPVLFFLHGNPTWSFTFRNLIKDLSKDYRCIAIDHIGCGLSDKPQDWPYRLQGHIENVEGLALELGLRDITLCLHDWGGAIGMGFARRHPEKVSRLVLMNTAAFLSTRIPLRISVCRAPAIGSFLVRRMNAFAGMAPTMGIVQRENMSPIVKSGYLAPYDSYNNRIATWRFVKDIPLRAGHPSYGELKAIDEALGQFADRPTCILWGERDFCFTTHFRDIWKERFPKAEVHSSREAGHFVHEDVPREALTAIRNLLENSPASRETR